MSEFAGSVFTAMAEDTLSELPRARSTGRQAEQIALAQAYATLAIADNLKILIDFQRIND